MAAALVALVGLSGTTVLGFWQYSRAHRADISRMVLSAPGASARSLVTPAQYVPESAFAHRVTMAATLRAEHALATCGRTELGWPRGCWLLAPAFATGETHGITVVLGFVPESEMRTSVDTLRRQGTSAIHVDGRLQPGELIDKGRAILRPARGVDSINVNELAMRWGASLLDGYVVLDDPHMGSRVSAALILPPSGITWRNLFYAWQWWAFAGFVLFLLARYVIDVRNEPLNNSLADAGARKEET